MGALPKPGDVLAGKYRLERVLGEGGMGVVYEATHLRLRQKCAIKMLLPEVMGDAELVTRFEREARAAATLRHPNVVQVLDVDSTSDGVPYMVIELLAGHDLAEELASRGTLPVEEAVNIAITTCAALAHAHAKGIVHRDLKPSNLYLAEADGERTLKLLDFGISKVLGDDADGHVTSSLQVFGTPFYMSPEQVRSVRAVDGRSDIWSLGVVLFQLVTGQVPFDGTPTAVVAAIAADPVPSVRERCPALPEELAAVIGKALRKDPAERFADARTFAMALLPFAGGASLPPGFGKSAPRVGEPARAGADISSSRVSVPGAAPRADLAFAQTQDLASFAARDSGGASAADSRPEVRAPAPTPRHSPSDASTLGPAQGKAAWSKASATAHPSRTLIVGAVAAALVAVGAIALVRARGGPGADAPDARAMPAASTALAASPTAPAAPSAPATQAPAPPAQAPAPPAVATALARAVDPPVPTVAPAAARGSHPRAGASHPAPPPASAASAQPAPPANAPPPPAPPKPAASAPPALANPLTL